MLLDTEVDLDAISRVAGVEITDAIVKDICNTEADVLTLNMTSCHKVTDLGLASVGRHWKNLEKVTIADCPTITHVGLRSLALNCRNLQTISFDDIDDSGLRIIAANLTSLEHIDLCGCRKVTDRGLSEIAHCCRKLKALNLSGCYKIGESGIWGLCELVHCQRLEAIDLCGCTYLSDKGLWAVAKRCPSLTKIHVSNCPYLSGRVVGKVLTITRNLIDLALSDTCKDWSSDDITMIIDGCRDRIQRLDFSYSLSLRQKEVELICRCSKLVELKLSGCQIGDEGILMIAKKLPELVTMELFGCEISEMSVTVLAPKQGGVGLSHLGLTGCDLINLTFLNTMAQNYFFSKLIADENFFGFQPDDSETELRRDARITYLKLLASTNIQRMIRGKLVRAGIYREKRDKLVVEHGIPKLQAHFRRRKQVALAKNLLKQKRERIAAQRIQLALQNHRWNQHYKKCLSEHQVRRKKMKVASVIQRYYRGYLGRILASDRRYFREIAKYRENKQNFKCQQAAIDIQSVARGMIATTTVQRIRKRQETVRLFQQKQIMSSINIQGVVRGFISRRGTKRLRFNLDLAKKKWSNARQIQCAWKVIRARRVLVQLRYFKQIEIHKGKAVILQSMWRSQIASKKARLLKGLRDLRKREVCSSMSIQRLYRGMKGRKKADSMRTLVTQELRRNQAVNEIQRVYRGFKGKQIAFKRLKLKSIEWKVKPVRDQVTDIDKKLHDCDLALLAINDGLESEETRLEIFEKELSTVSESKKKFVDSTVVNGVLQRCARTLVKSTLQQEIQRIQKAIENIHCDQENLSEQSRNLRREKRELLHTIEQF